MVEKRTPGQRLIDGATEALAIARGEQPAAAIWVDGHQYVPAAEIQRLRAEVERLETLLRDMSSLVDAGHSREQTFLDLVADRNSWRDQAQRDMKHAVAARSEAFERAAQIASEWQDDARPGSEYAIACGDLAWRIRAEASKKGGDT